MGPSRAGPRPGQLTLVTLWRREGPRQQETRTPHSRPGVLAPRPRLKRCACNTPYRWLGPILAARNPAASIVRCRMPVRQPAVDRMAGGGVRGVVGRGVGRHGNGALACRPSGLLLRPPCVQPFRRTASQDAVCGVEAEPAVLIAARRGRSAIVCATRPSNRSEHSASAPRDCGPRCSPTSSHLTSFWLT